MQRRKSVLGNVQAGDVCAVNRAGRGLVSSRAGKSRNLSSFFISGNQRRQRAVEVIFTPNKSISEWLASVSVLSFSGFRNFSNFILFRYILKLSVSGSKERLVVLLSVVLEERTSSQNVRGIYGIGDTKELVELGLLSRVLLSGFLNPLTVCSIWYDVIGPKKGCQGIS